MGKHIKREFAKKFLEIPDDEKWMAVEQCNKEYDGLFYYGVRTTGIFCRPSCRAKTPVRANVAFFSAAAAAMAEGFRPCKKCRPDQSKYEPEAELADKAKKLLDESFQDKVDFAAISKQLGVSENHLARIFKQVTGITPAKYVSKVRISRSVELLAQEGSDILDISGQTGFTSLSAFYRSFKEITGYTPGGYRTTRSNGK